MMTFLHSRYNSRINFSPKEIFDISEEISREFAPGIVIDRPKTVSQTRLSSAEMLEISQEISRDFFPGFATEIPGPATSHELSPREMSDISEEISREFAPKRSTGNYGLVLLPVDPEHLHAYWNLEENQLNITREIDAGGQLTLRVYSEPDKNANVSRKTSWFDVAIDSVQAQQTVSLPMRGDEMTYSATIGQRNPDNSFAGLASSNSVDALRGKVTAYQNRDDKIALSKPVSHPNAEHYLSNNASGQSNIQ